VVHVLRLLVSGCGCLAVVVGGVGENTLQAQACSHQVVAAGALSKEFHHQHIVF